MAEFCKECFIKKFHPSKEDISNLVLSNDNDFCEGCGDIKPIVLYIKEIKDLTNSEN